MIKHIKQVAQFHRAFGHPVNDTLKFLPIERIVLRHSLIQEEVNELLSAGATGDIVGVADAIADCLYILYGTALEWGLGDKLPAIFDEVHRSNMSKLGADGKPVYREDGKILKGENYTPPQIKDMVWADPE